MEELSTRRRGRTVGDRKCVSNTVMLIYRHDMSSGLQEYVSMWTLTHFESFYHNPISRRFRLLVKWVLNTDLIENPSLLKYNDRE